MYREAGHLHLSASGCTGRQAATTCLPVGAPGEAYQWWPPRPLEDLQGGHHTYITTCTSLSSVFSPALESGFLFLLTFRHSSCLDSIMSFFCSHSSTCPLLLSFTVFLLFSHLRPLRTPPLTRAAIAMFSPVLRRLPRSTLSALFYPVCPLLRRLPRSTPSALFYPVCPVLRRLPRSALSAPALFCPAARGRGPHVQAA